MWEEGKEILFSGWLLERSRWEWIQGESFISFLDPTSLVFMDWWWHLFSHCTRHTSCPYQNYCKPVSLNWTSWMKIHTSQVTHIFLANISYMFQLWFFQSNSANRISLSFAFILNQYDCLSVNWLIEIGRTMEKCGRMGGLTWLSEMLGSDGYGCKEWD